MRSTRRQLVSELLLLAVWAVVTFLAAVQLDLFELFDAWSRQHEELNVDELGAVSVVVMLGLGLFGWRRYRDAQAEARRAQEARDTLWETSDRYQSLFTHNPHGVYSLDLSGNFVSVNNAAQDLSGYDESQLLGKNFVELLAPGHLEDTMDLFVLALSGTAGTLDIAIVRADGEEVDLTIQASPIVVRDQVVGVYGVAEDITAEREMARDLRRTQAAVEATLDGVLIGDEDHRIVYANEASVRLHGYDAAEEMFGQPIENFLDSADSHVFASTVMGLVGTTGRWTGQLVGTRRDATSFAAEASISLLADGRLVAIGRDVTARVEAERALRESEERYRAVLADIGGGYYEADLDGDVTYLNDASADIVGRPREEVLGTRFDRYAAADAVATLREHAQRVQRTGVTDHGFDWHLITPDGERRLISTSVAAVRGETGEILGFRGLMHDVTDRHETQRALSLSEERHRLLARVTREVVWDGDPETESVTLSGAIRDLFGFPHDTVQVEAQWWMSRIHPDDVDTVFASVRDALTSSGEQWVAEYRIKDHHDRYLTVMARGLIIRDESGRAIRLVGSLVDITQRRRDEEELRLAHRAAKDATEAKSLFLANMSHEIRTPLTTVIAGTEMCLDTEMDPHQDKVLRRVHRAGERLLKLVDDLLDFSKIEAGQIRVDALPFDPATTVRQTAAWARDSCVDKGLDFRLTMSDTVPQEVLGDPHRLGQVLTNLVGNAVKFTASGHVHLSVWAEDDGPGSTRLSCEIEDTGPGISLDHQAHVFQSFSQADPSITRKYGGSGLGLAIAKDLVEFMGGTIGVESRPGEGSRFFFDVPFVLAPAPLPAPAGPSSTA